MAKLTKEDILKPGAVLTPRILNPKEISKALSVITEYKKLQELRKKRLQPNWVINPYVEPSMKGYL